MKNTKQIGVIDYLSDYFKLANDMVNELKEQGVFVPNDMFNLKQLRLILSNETGRKQDNFSFLAFYKYVGLLRELNDEIVFRVCGSLSPRDIEKTHSILSRIMTHNLIVIVLVRAHLGVNVERSKTINN